MKRYNFRLCDRYGDDIDVSKSKVCLSRVETPFGEYIKYGDYLESVNSEMKDIMELLVHYYKKFEKE